MYVRQLVMIMRRQQDLTLERFRAEIAAADLAQQARRLAESRLNLAEPYVDDNATSGRSFDLVERSLLTCEIRGSRG